MIEIINKPLLLHLVGYLYYWQMGFNSVFKGLKAPEVRAVKQRKRRMDAYVQYKITVKDTEGSSLPQLQYNYYDLDTVSQS